MATGMMESITGSTTQIAKLRTQSMFTNTRTKIYPTPTPINLIRNTVTSMMKMLATDEDVSYIERRKQAA